MNFQRISTSISLVLGAVVLTSNSAQAANFTTNFTAEYQKNEKGFLVKDDQGNAVVDGKRDIWLNSITQNGKTVSNFSFVNKVVVKENTPINLMKEKNSDTTLLSQQLTNTNSNQGKTNNTGAASTDRGDLATAPLAVSGIKDPTGAEIAAFLGNKNLNNIVDTEDDNSFFKLDVFFDSVIQKDNTGLDNFFFWERGMNSDIGVQAIDKAGNLIGSALTLFRKDQAATGFNLDTTETNAQKVGSWGVSLGQLGITEAAGLRLSATNKFNGPDFKVLARKNEVSSSVPKTTPEPGTLLALAALATGSLTLRRRTKLN